MVIALKTFVPTASLVASWAGVPDLGVVEYPGTIAFHTEAEIRENLEKLVLDRILERLSKPAGSPGEGSGVAATGKNPEEIVFRGTFEEVNGFFLQKGWTDQLPVVPPTPEKVEQFLKYTDRSPDKEVAILPQANLRATPRNIAVNAVMAGCRPEYMPLLIAAVEAVGEPDFQLISIGSTGNKIPWLLVNGPIVKQLGIEHGVGARSRGPNPALGRALGLILNNIAGFRYGETLMATWGAYLPFVLAEDEDACDELGWEPYHVEHGFGRDTSTVTARTTVYWGGQARHTNWGDTSATPPPAALAASVLGLATMHQKRQVMSENSIRFGARNNVAVLITLCTAKVLADAGYSKRDVAQYLWENTRITVAEANAIMQNFTSFGLTIHDLVKEGTLPEWFDVAPDETIPLFASVEPIDVVVCGDPNKDKLMSLWANYNRPVTRKIELPARWDELLKERKQ
ncbi:MAG: hypothetical protein HYX92_03490 [Chloroflexi bacterium]|nr:hypothetical protein [Chloroflexota bacterium]